MTGRSSEGMPARPRSMPPLTQPPITDLRIARLLETTDDENAAVEGVERTRLARTGLATLSPEACARRRAGLGGGPS